MEDNTERRQFKRVKIEKMDADYKIVDFTFWAEYRAQGHNLLNDISLGGISFSAKNTLPKDSLLNLKLKNGDMVKVGDIFGRVVRIRELNNQDYEIGVNFSWWDDEQDKKKLRNILENIP
ncbi:MAG: PilZ domain-containing protein [Candidatus Omnitrophota bacterium]